MKKIILTLTLILSSVSFASNGYIDCRFSRSDYFAKLSILVEEGSHGMALEYRDSTEPVLTKISGRDGEIVNFYKIGNEGRFFFEAKDLNNSEKEFIGILNPDSGRFYTIEFFETRFGRTYKETGFCVFM